MDVVGDRLCLMPLLLWSETVQFSWLVAVVDFQDWMHLLIAAGLSAAIGMGFWVLWLKTRQLSFKKVAMFLGPLPVVFISLVLILRVTLGSGVRHGFDTGVAGSMTAAVVRELAFPVEDPEIDHLIEVTPVLEHVKLMGPDGEEIELRRSVDGGVLKLDYDAQRQGSYKLVVEIPAGIEFVRVFTKEYR